MKKLVLIAAMLLSAAARAGLVVDSIPNALGGEILFTDIKNDQCPVGTVAISYSMSGHTIFGCWISNETGTTASVVWSSGQINVYPINRKGGAARTRAAKDALARLAKSTAAAGGAQ